MVKEYWEQNTPWKKGQLFIQALFHEKRGWKKARRNTEGSVPIPADAVKGRAPYGIILEATGSSGKGYKAPKSCPKPFHC